MTWPVFSFDNSRPKSAFQVRDSSLRVRLHKRIEFGSVKLAWVKIWFLLGKSGGLGFSREHSTYLWTL